MKKIISISIIFLLTFVSSIEKIVAQSGTATANSTAEIVAPLIITDNSGVAGGTTLDFGRLTVSSTSPGACIVTAGNVRSVEGGVTAIDIPTTSTASFAVTGKAGATYAITFPAVNPKIRRSGGLEEMEVSNFSALPASEGVEKNTGTLVGGNDTFTVGGKLNVVAGQAEGTYSGTFNVTVAYN